MKKVCLSFVTIFSIGLLGLNAQSTITLTNYTACTQYVEGLIADAIDCSSSSIVAVGDIHIIPSTTPASNVKFDPAIFDDSDYDGYFYVGFRVWDDYASPTTILATITYDTGCGALTDDNYSLPSCANQTISYNSSSTVIIEEF